MTDLLRWTQPVSGLNWAISMDTATRPACSMGEAMSFPLFRSQLDTLEPLEDDEAGVVVSIAQPPSAIVVEARQWLTTGRHRAGSSGSR